MNCIHCNSLSTVRYGYSEKGDQRFKCKDCGRRFCEKGIWARMRFPRETIVDTLFLRSYPLSTRNVKKILRKLKHIKVSHVSVFNWILKFAPHLIKLALKKPISFTKIWHVDEKFIKVKGSKDDFAYLWVVSDSENNILATHVSFARNSENAKIVLRKASFLAGFFPMAIVTDGLQGYKSACKIFGRKCKHVEAHFAKQGVVIGNQVYFLSNNRIERINGFFALWLHVCRGFKRLDNANLWVEYFAVHYNYLMPHGYEERVKVDWDRIPELIAR